MTILPGSEVLPPRTRDDAFAEAMFCQHRHFPENRIPSFLLLRRDGVENTEKERKHSMTVKKKKGRKAVCFGLLSAAILSTVPFSVLAEEQVTDTAGTETVSEEELNNNVIHFSEVPALMNRYSQLAELERKLLSDGTDGIRQAQSAAKEQKRDIIEQLNDMISDLEDTKKGVTEEGVRRSLQNQISSLKKVRDSRRVLGNIDISLSAFNQALVSLQKTEDSMDDAEKFAAQAIRSSLYTGKKMTGNGMQSVLFQYQSLRNTEDLLKKQVSIREMLYQKTAAKQKLGQATELEVQDELLSLTNARNNLISVRDSLDTMKRAIGLTLGWHTDSYQAIEIAEIPEADRNYLDSHRLSEDIEKVKQQNSNYGQALRTVKKNITGFTARDIDLKETDQQIQVAMETLYRTVQEKKQALELSETNHTLAQRKKEKAEHMNALGLLGRSDYAGMELDALNSENAVKSARLAYTEAVFDYDQAVKYGVLKLGS